MPAWCFREPGAWGQNNQGAKSMVGKSREQGVEEKFGERGAEEKFGEQGAEETNKGATQKLLREQGDCKNNLGSIEN